jgi:hypothetical protein
MTPDPFENVSAAFRGMDIKMEQIEAYYERSYQFDGEGGAVEFSFQIPPVAKYFAALAAEQRGELDSAEIYMRQALESMPASGYLKRESQRMQKGVREKVVFVFTLLGMVPHKIEVESGELTAVLKGAKALFAIAKPQHNPNAIDRMYFTAPVMIPAYPKRQTFWHGGFAVQAGGEKAETKILADFDRYAREEYKVLLSGILIRAAVRRAIKEAAGQALGRSVTKDKEGSKLLGDFFSSIASVAETVDTRSWCTLPREIRAAHLQVPDGTQSILLTPLAPNGSRMGPDVTVPLDMSSKEPAFVIVVHPGRSARPIVLVDAAHRVSTAP